MNLTITILAAGEGKRMRSSIPKVLHLFQGKPMLVSIIETSKRLDAKKIIIITGKHDVLIKETISKYMEIDNLVFIQQGTPLGTGDAIKCCLPSYNKEDKVLILNGDMPLINKEILKKFIDASPYEMNLLVARFSNPTGYGRIIYNEKKEFIEIVEEKDCLPEQKKIDIINSGLYYINADLLIKYIPMIENRNSQKEYYLTDIVKIIKHTEQININTFLICQDENKYISGVNTLDELEMLENEIKKTTITTTTIQNPLRQVPEPADVNKLIKKLEKEGMEKTAELNNKEIDDPNKMINELTKIMTDGDKEFKEKTGRHMTYAEMRATYG
jgi:UDP-N-acetylglucosamine diphosphorylase/glucosamine-1-phosphate N-acetyltransferase